MLSSIVNAINYLKARVTEYRREHSLVNQWEQRQKDQIYLQGQINKLRGDAAGIEGFLSDNPFGLEALDTFSQSEVNYLDTSTQTELLRGHNVANQYIFENRKRFETSNPERLDQYFEARKEFEEQLQKLNAETSS